MEKKKNLKGMTLYEMIISIAIFAIMSGVLIGIGIHANTTTRAANNLKGKVATESPYAANKITHDFETGAEFPKDDIEITIDLSSVGNLGTIEVYNPATGNKEPVSCDCSSPFVYPAYQYKTESAFTGDSAVTIDPSEINGNLNLEFVEMAP